MTPVHLRCDFRINPLGIDSAQPQLDWLLRAMDSQARGLTQSVYQILVASSPELLAADRGDLWDSGKVNSDRTNQISYAGAPLKSDQVVWWKVRVWDGAENVSSWSEPAHWTMGVLDPADWKARWITAPKNLQGDETSTVLLRREFAVKAGLKRATLSISGLGQYEATLNGGSITGDALTPGWTDYAKTCLYDTYDLTATLREGANALGVLLGNGMYRVKKSDRYAKFERTFGLLQLIARLRLEYADGTMEIIGTDENWRAGRSPMTFSSVYGGEDWDARLVQAGWDQPGFAKATTDWLAAEISGGPGGALKGTSRSAPPVRRFQAHTPSSRRELEPGVFIYDLGQQASHMTRFSVRGSAGSKIRITPTELLNADGSIFRNNYNGKAWSHFTLAGAGVETYMLKFFYSGHRYVQVEALPAKAGGALPEVISLEGLVTHSAVADAGEFWCSHETLNKIHAMVRWAELSNMMSVISDCPHRERLGWLEQSHLHGPSFRYSYEMRPFYAKILADMRDAQDESGLVPTHVPELAKFPPKWRDAIEWGSAGVLIPWQQYQWTGDVEVLRTNFPMMKRYLAYLTSRAKGHLAAKGLGDWSGRGATPETPGELVAAAFYYEDAATVAKAARLLGKEEDAGQVERLAADIREAFNAAFFSADKNQFSTGSQASNAFALALGLVSPEKRAAVLSNLVADLEQRGYALTVGEAGLPYLLRVLADEGRSDVIYRMAVQSEHPGYAYQLKMGATALCETWNAWRDNSQNQFMLGHITEWFYRDLAGIQLDQSAPGFGRVVIKPSMVAGVNEVKASYDSVRGKIMSEWKRDGRRVTLRVVVPPNAKATVIVPAEVASAITESGRPIGEQTGITRGQRRGAGPVLEIGSGDYSFGWVEPAP